MLPLPCPRFKFHYKPVGLAETTWDVCFAFGFSLHKLFQDCLGNGLSNELREVTNHTCGFYIQTNEARTYRPRKRGIAGSICGQLCDVEQPGKSKAQILSLTLKSSMSVRRICRFRCSKPKTHACF